MRVYGSYDDFVALCGGMDIQANTRESASSWLHGWRSSRQSPVVLLNAWIPYVLSAPLCLQPGCFLLPVQVTQRVVSYYRQRARNSSSLVKFSLLEQHVDEPQSLSSPGYPFSGSLVYRCPTRVYSWNVFALFWMQHLYYHSAINYFYIPLFMLCGDYHYSDQPTNTAQHPSLSFH